jgi:N-ethylmaleimide reductase
MSKDEVRRTVAEFGTAAKNAVEAGFDGVQIQANYLYLIAQFVNSATNLRQDEYGGSTVNRARFLFEITRMRLLRNSPKAETRCLATHSPIAHSGNETRPILLRA